MFRSSVKLTKPINFFRTSTITQRLLKRNFSSQKQNNIYEEWKNYRFPTALGFFAMSFIFLRRKTLVEIESTRTEEKEEEEKEYEYKRVYWENLKDLLLLKAVPYNLISSLWGKFHNVDIPVKVIRVKLFELWSNVFNCNLDEIDKELVEYRNLSQFFTRDLKDNSRTINNNSNVLVAPTDSKIFSLGSIELEKDGSKTHWSKSKVDQIKGRTYEIGKLLGNFESYLKEGKKLNYIVFYLSPGDYHHYHSPFDVKFYERRHFPGKLYPVKKSYLERVDNLYGINERVSLLGEWKQGFFSYVAVGACNVGSMTVDFDDELETNKRKFKNVDCLKQKYNQPKEVVKGERIGTFKLGSTIVLVFESDANFDFCVNVDEVVKIGQPVGFIGKRTEENKKECFYAPPWPKAKV